MQKFLSIKNIVDVKSIGVSDKFSLDRLNTLGIVKFNTQNPLDEVVFYKNKEAVLSDYGFGAKYEFAQTYFGFTSKNVTTPEVLGLYSWNESATSGYIRGTRSKSIDELKKLNGKFKISIDGEAKDVTLDLTDGGVVSYDNVASKVQEALRAVGTGGFSNATCIYSTITNGLIIGSGTTGANSSVGYATSPDDSEDLSGDLGISDVDAPRLIKGRDAIATLKDMLKRIAEINENYYVITPLFSFSNEEEDLKTFGQWTKDSVGRYLGIYLWNKSSLGVFGSKATDAYLQYDGLYIDYKKADNQNAFSSSIISSMSLGTKGGYFNVNFNECPQYLDVAVSDQQEFDGMNENRVNAPYVFGELGQYTVTYGQGKMMGSIDSANVYINNSFLIFQMQFAVANLFMSVGVVSLRGGSGISLIQSSLSPIFQKAVDNGLIIVDSLTTTEKNAITQNFNNSEDAISTLERAGWYMELGSVDVAKKQININFAYITNEPANRVVIKSYILGA